jgi:hypothetical protein
MTVNQILEILHSLKYRDWGFYLFYSSDCDHMYLQLAWKAADTTTGAEARQKSRKWLLSKHMTKTEIVNTAWFAVKTAIEHEAREEFFYKGKAIYNTHLDVAQLHSMADAVDARPPMASSVG